jgi:hypothetical protein
MNQIDNIDKECTTSRLLLVKVTFPTNLSVWKFIWNIQIFWNSKQNSNPFYFFHATLLNATRQLIHHTTTLTAQKTSHYNIFQDQSTNDYETATERHNSAIARIAITKILLNQIDCTITFFVTRSAYKPNARRVVAADLTTSLSNKYVTLRIGTIQKCAAENF